MTSESNSKERMSVKSENRTAAVETMDIVMEMSRLLNTGLNQETMAVCLRLCENGVNPEALAQVIKELRREAANMADTSGDSYTGRS